MALQRGVLAHQPDARPVADMDARQLRLLEIALDPERVAVDERHHAAAGGDVGAGPKLHVGDAPVDRGLHRRAFEVEPRQIPVGRRLIVGRLGLQIGGPGRLDPLLRHGGVAQLRIAGVIGRGLLGARPLALHHRLGLPQGQGEALRVDPEQDVAALHHAVVGDENLRDEARDIGGHRHHVGPHAPVPGPGGLHVVVPQREADDDGGRDHSERDEKAEREGEEPGHGKRSEGRDGGRGSRVLTR